ncbi:hypothetical protein BIW11_03577 [Tropilaelaps mercedesae]|uniref:Uncharacterized protein n=1 Tax=Tropilaelaps mercedesae TaxID=418985 RepID=A0A1V9XJB9_9ACAR|nr:hypothetical protein BIW11_03577 [Tropilaelaps mercedesae]
MPKSKAAQKGKKKRRTESDDLLKMIGSSANPDKRGVSVDAINLLQDVGRSYTETGRYVGETSGDNLLELIGAGSADQAVRAVAPNMDPAKIAAQVQAEVEARRRQIEEDRGGYPNGAR